MRSLRWRLVLAFACVAGAVVLAGAWSMTTLLEHATWASLDAALVEEAETIATIRDTDSLDSLRRVVTHIAAEPALGPGKVIRVTASDGTVLAEAGPGTPTGEDAAAHAAHGSAAATVTVAAEGDSRVVHYGTERVAITLELPVGEQRRALAIDHVRIWAGAIAIIAVLVALGVAITTRATNELKDIAAELETIEAGSLDRRLRPRATSEVDHLTAVLNRLLARLEKAMAHLGRFTADAAHELRTPVAALRAHLEVALTGPAGHESEREGLLDALAQAERLAGLTEALLTLSAVETDTTDLASSGDRVRLDDVAADVAQSVDLIAQDQGRRVTWQVEAGCIVGSAALIRRLLLNLVDNALRHTPSTADVRVRATIEGTSVRLEVEDDGPGIPDADLPRIFDRFARGTTTAGGYGLGLALCREIVERHHGHITIERKPAGGTRVLVIFERAREAA
mgnify:CR=1 FL=1